MNTKIYWVIIFALVVALTISLSTGIKDSGLSDQNNSQVISPKTGVDTKPYRLSCGNFLKMDLEIDDSDRTSNAMEVKVKAFLTAIGKPAKARSNTSHLPLNISFVLDTSGSMETHKKMELVKNATLQIASKLSPFDHISIITYATDGKLVLKSSKDNSIEHLTKVIEKIEPFGATNISEGLELSLIEINKQRSDRVKSHIVLLSDGKANFGIKDPAKLVEIAEQLALKQVSISTVGIGDGYNKDLLTDMAKTGNGRFYAVKDAATIFNTFTEDLKSLKNHIAKNILLTVKAAELVQVQGFSQTGSLLCRTSFLDSSPTFQIAGLAKNKEAGFLLSFKCPANESKPQKLATFTVTYTACKDGKESQETISLSACYRPKGKTVRDRWFTAE